MLQCLLGWDFYSVPSMHCSINSAAGLVTGAIYEKVLKLKWFEFSELIRFHSIGEKERVQNPILPSWLFFFECFSKLYFHLCFRFFLFFIKDLLSVSATHLHWFAQVWFFHFCQSTARWMIEFLSHFQIEDPVSETLFLFVWRSNFMWLWKCWNPNFSLAERLMLGFPCHKLQNEE